MEHPATYDIGDGFALAEAESEEFARFHAVYRADPFLRDEAELYKLFCDGAPCRWILLNGRRVGGMLAGGGVMGQFFLIPPFEQKAEALRRVSLFLHRQDSGRLFAHGVTMEELDDYFPVGFRLTAAVQADLAEEEPDYSWQFMRVMVRPTQEMPESACAATLRPPRKSDASRIAALLEAAYGGGDPMRQSGDSFRQDVVQYFLQEDRAMREASSLATADGKLLGACLVVRWEGTPLVFDIAVDPQARSGGIARAMLSRALTTLCHGGEKRLRLFVECGNPAESLYHAMGFLAGPKMTSMTLR